MASSPLFGYRRTTTRAFVSREELKLLLQMEPEEADVTSSEAEMIDKIFDLGETTVREVMVPMVEVAALPETASPEDCVRLIGERGFSRIPIYADRIFNVVGVVTAMDLLRQGADARRRARDHAPGHLRARDQAHRRAAPRDAEGARPARRGRRRVRRGGGHRHRGGHRRGGGRARSATSTIATLDTVERLPDGSYRVAGRANVDEVNEALDWDLPKGDFETVAGLVLATVHRIPLVGEVLHVGRYTVTVLEADERRVLTVRISRFQGREATTRASPP